MEALPFSETPIFSFHAYQPLCKLSRGVFIMETLNYGLVLSTLLVDGNGVFFFGSFDQDETFF